MIAAEFPVNPASVVFWEALKDDAWSRLRAFSPAAISGFHLHFRHERDHSRAR
jgi:hypothetical protein